MSKIIKKILVLLILVITFSTSKVYSLTKTELKNLNLTRLKLYSLEIGYKSVQGGTITDKYIILSEIYNDDGKTALVVIDKNTYKKVKVIKNYKFNHANDMTYNSSTNKVIITGGKAYPKLYILDGDTLKQEKIVITSRGYSSIAYDDENDKYIARRGKKAYILDLKFNEEESFDISEEDLTTQGFEVKNGKLYFTCYEAGKITNYQKKYTRILKANENVIVVYDLKTKEKEKVYYIPQVNNEGIYPGEIEGISFINNTPIIWTNKKGYINLFTTIANKPIEKVEIKTSEEIENNKILVKLYKDGKLVDQAYNKDGKFVFKELNSNKEETVTYDVITKSSEYNVSTDKIKIITDYDFYTNELSTVVEDDLVIEKIENKKESEENIEIEEKDTSKDKKDKKKVDKKKANENKSILDKIINVDINKNIIDEVREEVEEEIKKNNEIKREIEENKNNEVEIYETKENDENNVEVPNTSTKRDYSIIGILMILLSLVIIKIKRNN